MSGAPALSIHVVDIARGMPAAGMAVDLYSVSPEGNRHCIFHEVRLDDDGKAAPDADALAGLTPGRFEVCFHVAAYYRAAGWDLASMPFIDVLPYRFGIDSAARHHHLPAKITPFGISLFLTK